MNGNDILLISTDQSLIKTLRYRLEEVGYGLVTASHDKEAVELIKVKKPVTIISEIHAPEIDGIDLCRHMRYEEKNWTPIILLSDHFHELDAVLGLELGADAYYAKPVHFKKLVAKIKAILRRAQVGLGESKIPAEVVSYQKKNRKLTIGDIDIFPESYTVYYKKEPIELTQKEFEIFMFLYEYRGKAVSRKKLLTAIRGYEETGDHRIIDVFINRIRSKIEPSHSEKKYIKTVRNVGYMLQDMSSKVLSFGWVVII
ncbi:response regulator transcription factor [Alkalihalobacterium chitinilyticum]|uniref:Response regulator transcription factor n=1 Tax=Alkalihalobacterium chitinilyticum TaxID=2980103 RepID=A0ABT5VBE8_9BACI|nr:response regulator transcription factor [Alkalihalobacterium chitinilyticum]MDE5412471.1 response regulator transcription factor [Alkalihalobacterium chitinilyticum]